MIERFFSRYPKEFRWLFPIFMLQQYTYQTILDIVKDSQGQDWSDTKYYIINGFFILMAGFLADRYDDLKKRLASIAIFIAIGGLVITFDDGFFLMFGFLIFQLSSCIFFITILVRIAQFFISADVIKFDAFLGLTVFSSISSILFFIIVNVSVYFEIDFLEITFLVLSFGGIFYFIQQLEYSQLPIRKPEQSNPNFVMLLLGVIGVSILITFMNPLSEEMLASIEVEYNPIEFFFLAVLFLLISGYTFYWIFKKKLNYQMDFLRLVIICLSIVFVLYVLIYINLKIKVVSIISVASFFNYFVYYYFLSPIFIVLLTHNYFGKNMGKVIGLEASIPPFVSAIVMLFINPSFYSEAVLIVLAIILLLIPVLYKHKESLTQILRINQPHEVEIIEAEPEDPFDHFIENNL